MFGGNGGYAPEVPVGRGPFTQGGGGPCPLESGRVGGGDC